MWANFQGINDAKNMTISSYSLVLMVIHFLQHGVSPPVLPCLQQNFMEKYSYLMDLVKLRNTYHDSTDTCYVPEPFESKNTQTLGELLVKFLEYFAVTFDYSTNAVSVRNGSVVSIKSCMNNRARKNDAHQWKYMCIEEPFEFTNTARSVYDRDVFDRIRGVFFASWQRLFLSNDLESLFSVIQLTEARHIGTRLRDGSMAVYKKLCDVDVSPCDITPEEICAAVISQAETEDKDLEVEEDQKTDSSQDSSDSPSDSSDSSPDFSDSEESIHMFSSSDENEYL